MKQCEFVRRKKGKAAEKRREFEFRLQFADSAGQNLEIRTVEPDKMEQNMDNRMHALK